jgi:hypothetical protein
LWQFAIRTAKGQAFRHVYINIQTRYTSLAILTPSPCAPLLAVADFHNATVQLFDNDFSRNAVCIAAAAAGSAHNKADQYCGLIAISDAKHARNQPSAEGGSDCGATCGSSLRLVQK